MTERMTPEERRIQDARTKEEAWSFAAELLMPMQKTAELAGSDELIEALGRADQRCVRELNAALGVLEGAEEGERMGAGDRLLAQAAKETAALWVCDHVREMSPRESVGYCRAAAESLDHLIELAQHGPEPLFFVLMDAKARCRKHIRMVEEADKGARAEKLRAELRELEGTPEQPVDPAAALSQVNIALSNALDLLEEASPDAFVNPNSYFEASSLIAKAGGIVARREEVVARREEPPASDSPAEPESGGRASA